MATFWNRSQRLANGVEQRMLAVYHQALTQFGVQGYSFADLMLDYRLMLSYMLFDPVADLARGSPRSYWWPKLNCLVEAYQDWDCGSL
jgi:hypothetical protein